MVCECTRTSDYAQFYMPALNEENKHLCSVLITSFLHMLDKEESVIIRKSKILH
jgi:hypothetical protein